MKEIFAQKIVDIQRENIEDQKQRNKIMNTNENYRIKHANGPTVPLCIIIYI